MRKFLLLLLLLIFPAVSWGADAGSVTLIVTGTDAITSPDVVTEYSPAVLSGDEVIEEEVIGEVNFPALSGNNYTFATIQNALTFAENPKAFIEANYRGQYYNNPSYDITYDATLETEPINTTVTVSIQIGTIDSVTLSDYSSLTDITFTATRTLTCSGRHFTADNSSGTVTFSAITFNGNDNTGGGVVVTDGTVTFTRCTFNRCDATNGGGVAISGGTVTMTAPTFSGCYASARGGAVSISNGTATITGANFANCSAADYGGAVSLTGGSATISGSSTFTGNSSYRGGAISVTGGNLSLLYSSFTNNEASNDGGAIYSASGLTIGASVIFNTVTDSSPNKALNGGAIYIQSGTTTISGSQALFTENSAEVGGAVYIASGTLNITGDGATFTGNTASENGGGIFAGTGARVNISGADVSFTDNKALSGDGGAFYVSTRGTLSISGSSPEISSNTAEYSRGGAFFLAGGSTLNLAGEMTLSQNTANYGGCVYMSTARNATNFNITATSGDYDVTFSQNEAATSGGAIYAETNCYITPETTLVFSSNRARNGNGGALWLTECEQLPEGTIIFDANRAVKSDSRSTTTGSGGAVYVLGSSTSTAVIGSIRKYTFSGTNTAMSYGGAVCTSSGDITFQDYTSGNAITSANTARLGGGFAASYGGTIRFNNCTVCNQSATNGSGGAVWARNVIITSCDFGAENSPNSSLGTTTNDGGGAIYAGGTLTITNSTLSYNTSEQAGGAVNAVDSQVNITNSYFHHNNARNGNGGAATLLGTSKTRITSSTFESNRSENLDGGAINVKGEIEITNSYFRLNRSRRSGGAIYFDQYQSPFTVSSTMFDENSTEGGTDGGNGGAIYAFVSVANITSCTFTKNHLDLGGNTGFGGALYLNTTLNQATTNRVENCTFYENMINDGASPSTEDLHTGSGGGGLYVECESRTNITSCTFVSNGSRYKGGAVLAGASDGTMSLAGVIAVGNTSLGISDIWADGNIASGGYNRIGAYGTGSSGITDFYSDTRNETDSTGYPSKGWSKATFFSGNTLAVNARTDLGGDIPPYIGSIRAGQVRILTLMLSEDASLPLSDRATNIIPYSRRQSFPDTDERGVSRTSGGESIKLDIGACFFDGTRYAESEQEIASYTISRVEISGIPNNLRRVGQTASLVAKVYYTNGRTALGGTGTNEEPVTWTSDKPNIIRINENTGDITVLNFTPGNTYVTITVKTVRGNLSGEQVSDSKPIRVTEYTASYLNTTPSVMDYLQGYTEELTEYDISLRLLEGSSSTVTSSAFQSAFSAMWDGVTASQVQSSDIAVDTITLGKSTSYTASDGYTLVSGKPGVDVNVTGRREGDLLPLIFTWTFSGAELRNVLGYDMSGKTLNESVADEVFSAMRIDFRSGKSSWPVIGSGGVKASDAMRAGALKLSGDGGNGITAELTAYLANVTASGGNGVTSSANNGPQIVNGILIVPDGNGKDGKISGTMLMAHKTGASTNTGTNTNVNTNTGNSSGGGGGGCNSLGLMAMIAALVLIRKR